MEKNICLEYVNAINQISFLSKKEERLILEEAKKGNSVARDNLILSNLAFAINRSKGIIGKFDEDSIQAGIMGLSKAVERFDLSYKNRFNTYAEFWINREIRRELISRNSAKIPDFLKSLCHEIYDSDESIESRPEVVKKVNRLIFFPMI